MPPRKLPPRSAGVKIDKEQTLQQYVAEYFAEKNADMIVRRGELAKVLVNYHMVQEQRSTWAKIKRGVMKFYLFSARAPLADKT